MDVLLLDFVPPPEKKAYIIDVAAFAIINKFIIKHGYKVTE